MVICAPGEKKKGCGRVLSSEKFEYEEGENRFASKAIEWSTPVTDEVKSIDLGRKKT